MVGTGAGLAPETGCLHLHEVVRTEMTPAVEDLMGDVLIDDL